MSADTQLACANIEFAHRAHDLWNGDERETWLDLWAPEGEWDMSNLAGWPERTVWRGRDQLGEMWDLWKDSWDEFHIELREVKAVDDELVFSVVYQRGLGKGSGVPVEQTLGGINLMRDGKAIRYESWSDLEAARRRAGAHGGGLDLVKPLWSRPRDMVGILDDEAWVARARPRFESRFADDFTFTLAQPDSPAIGGTWSGFDGFVEAMREWLSAWASWKLDPFRFIDTGACVVVLSVASGRAAQSGIEAHGEDGEVYFLEDERIARQEAYQSYALALQAAGLSEQLAS